MSSSSTTSTLSTSTSCYSSVAAGAISQACARKRKSIITEEIFGIDDSIEAEATHEEMIASSMDESSLERLVVHNKYTAVRQKKTISCFVQDIFLSF